MSEIKKINETYDILLDLKKDFKKDLATEAVDPGDNVDFKDNAVKNSYPSRDNINQQLLKDVQDAAKAANVNVSITTAQSGHEGLPSRHPSGNAVDISIINGKNVSLANRSDADQFVNALVKMGYVKNSESGNPKAVLTFGFKDHDDHVHVSNQGDSSSATIQSGTTQSGTTQPTTLTPDEAQFGKVDTDSPEYSALAQAASKFGLKEEKIYSKLGNKISVRNRSIIIPSNSNTTIKSPIDGVVNNFHSDRSCINQLTIQHSIENKTYYLQFCGISDPKVKDGKRVSKGDILGKTTTDVTVSLFDKVWEQIYLTKMLDKELPNDVIVKNNANNRNNRNNNEYKKETEYYDPFYPWIGKKILGLGKKIPSMSKGGEPKIKNFFNKNSMTSKKIDENIERIKKLLK